ncbi:SDR family NAD(P)-dependent oxidoreductase [Flavitalea flava]
MEPVKKEEYQNKTVIITGAAKGIGAACALRFRGAGARVALLDIIPAHSGPEPEDQTNWFYQTCDVSDETQVREAMANIIGRWGRIDILINNAGIQRYGSVTESSLEDWDLVMNVNLKSMFLCSKYAIPHMQQQESGVVINVSSVQAFVSQQTVAAYTTAKTAILGLTRSIAVDYAPAIRCLAVCPGTIDTPMLRDAIALSPDPVEVMQECVDMHLSKRIGTAEEVAGLVLFLCSGEAAFMTGQSIRIDGGLGITIPGSKK